MKTMCLEERTKELAKLFSYDNRVMLPGSPVEIHPFRFHQEVGEEDIELYRLAIPVTGFCAVPDSKIIENKDFTYTVFLPKGGANYSRAILLLHGLNERQWDKYLTWAEELVLRCGVPVILFPIAFHMNRTPANWYSPRWLLPWLNKRKQEILNLCNASFFNVALSSRLSDSPLRFYVSGRESALNICQLVAGIKEGKHPLFREDCQVDLFAYSIGALLSQVLLIADPNGYFSSSRLFTFCGGSIFEKMNGNAKDIIDQNAYDTIKNYYLNYFVYGKQALAEGRLFRDDALERAFRLMIAPDVYAPERHAFFEKAKDRVQMVSLKKDIVVPTVGLREAVGEELAPALTSELDFPYEYSHQTPFPSGKNIPFQDVFLGFRTVFDKAAGFLSSKV